MQRLAGPNKLFQPTLATLRFTSAAELDRSASFGGALRFLLVIVGVLMLIALPVLADSAVPPRSYTVLSPNGQYVFVMIAPLSLEEEVAQYEEWYVARIREIRRTYPASGMYRNDGSTSPLWTVDWYASQVEVASDGMHLVRPGPAAMRPTDEAVAFFANGQLVRAYRVADLVDLPWVLPRSVSHLLWQADARFDETSMRYTIRTNHGEQIVFDVTTGTMIQASHPVRWVGGLGISAVLLLVWGYRRMARAA